MSFCRGGTMYLARYTVPPLQKLMMLNTTGKSTGKEAPFPQGKMSKTFSARTKDLTAAQDVFKGDVNNKDLDPKIQMEACSKPIIGAINGFAVTAGFEIALACDILVASKDAKFVDTHCKFGIFPSWGLSQKLPRIIGVNRAKELSLTAKPLDAMTAERWGLVNRVVESGVVLEAAIEIGEAIVQNRQDMVVRYKAVINDGFKLSLGDGAILEKERAHKYYDGMKPEEFMAMQKYISSRASTNKKPTSKL